MLDYLKELENNGYITKNGTPLKCRFCDCTDLETTDEYFEEHMLVEYTLKCKKCGNIAGTWAYGGWML